MFLQHYHMYSNVMLLLVYNHGMFNILFLVDFNQ